MTTEVSFDRSRAMQLLIGITGIYSIYFYCAFLQQTIIKSKYQNELTGEYQSLELPYAQLIFVGLFSYVLGTIYNLITYPKEQCFVIPDKHSIKCGAAVVSNVVAYSYAIFYTNYPVVMMVRSCNLLSVALVAVIFTGVKDTSMKLGTRKIAMASVVTVGIIIFKVFDPNQEGEEHQTKILGVVLMIISLVAQGFLPDFQAVIKQKYRPHPTVILAAVNKWTFLLSLLFSIVTGHLLQIFSFIYHHQDVIFDLLMVSIFSFVGQVFIYRLVKQFKQHVVPFIITTRKIFTVAFSIAYFGHQYNKEQVFGILIVLGTALFQFTSEIKGDLSNKIGIQNNQETAKETKKQ